MLLHPARFSTQLQFMKHFAQVKQIKMTFLDWPCQTASNCEMQTLDNMWSFIFFLSGFKSWTSLEKTKYCWNLKTHFHQSCCFCRSLYMICVPINVSTAWFIAKGGSVCLCYTLQTARLLKDFPSLVHKTPVQQHFFKAAPKKRKIYNLQLSVLVIGIPHRH